MSDKANTPEQESNLAPHVPESVDTATGSARRRMLKKGVGLAPIVLTLASRPVLAWHCKSPSAWGSEQLDSATSLATNAGHESYTDETWTIDNWKNNTSRAGLGKPWSKLGFGDNEKDKDKNWRKAKVAVIQTKGLVLPPGVDGNTKMVDFLGNAGTLFQKTVVVAQLNVYLLSSARQCVSLDTVKTMASGTYSPSHVSVIWNQTDIVRYLQNNWIATP